MRAWRRWAMPCCRAHVMRTAAGGAGGTARAVPRREGRPATQAVPAEHGGVVLHPWQRVWPRVRAGPRPAVGEPHGVTDDAAPVLDEMGEGAPGGARRPERPQRVAMGEQPCEWACSIRGGVVSPAGRAGCARPRQPPGRDGHEAQQVILAHGGAQGALVACATKG